MAAAGESGIVAESTGSSALRGVCHNLLRRPTVTDVHHLDDTEPTDATVVQHATDAADDPGHDAHGDDADGHDAHGDGHDQEQLGPVNVPAWGAGIIGVLAGLAVATAFMLATAPI
jgi:hypothetical protein